MSLAATTRPVPSSTRPARGEARARAANRARDVLVVLVANAIALAGLWVRHGGLGTVSAPGGLLTAVGQLTGLFGTYAALIQVLLMSRIGWLERFVGFDRLAVWHRWTGFAVVTLLTVHAVSITFGYAAASGRSIPTQLGDFVQHYPDVLMSIVGLALFVAIACTSVRAARRRLRRETWYALHLYAYLAIALSFAHQLAVGADFTDDALARAWWIALYAAVGGAVLAWRVGRPIAFNLRHQLRVDAVRPAANGIVSIYVAGRNLDQVHAEAGQFFLWRFLTGTGWAKAHPFSLSAAPNGKVLRITVKDLGDDTRRLQLLRPGVRVFAEGPYGAFTAQLRTHRRVALIAGGIGITPLRALAESLPGDPGDIVLLYRVASDGDVAFRKELAAIASRRGVDVRILVGSDIGDDTTDQLGIPALRDHVPDIAAREVYLCGPPSMLTALSRRLAALGVPRAQVHFERFDY